MRFRVRQFPLGFHGVPHDRHKQPSLCRAPPQPSRYPVAMTSQATDTSNSQHFLNASQDDKPTLMPKQETASPELASSVSGSSLPPKSPRL